MNQHVNIAASIRRAAEDVRLSEMAQARAVLRDRCTPAWVVEIIMAEAQRYGASPDFVVSRSHQLAATYARHAAIYAVKAKKPHLSRQQIARWFNRELTTIAYSLASHAAKHGLPSLTLYDLERRNRTMRQHRERTRKAA